MDPRPWSSAGRDDNAIGEIWYERSGSAAVAPALLLKLLFTDQPLSIQVHPDDAYAQSIGLLNGKTEAWYVLSASREAKVALGLKRRLTPQQMRAAADDGSIADLVVWQTVAAGDTVFVPAGTIHAIGAGLVIAEIQQRSDATFRLIRSWPGPRTSYRQCYRGGRCRPCRHSGPVISTDRQPKSSDIECSFHIRKNRPGAEIRLVPGSKQRDLASRYQRQRSNRFVRRRDGRRRFRAVGSSQHSMPACSACQVSWPIRAGSIPELLQHADMETAQ